MHPILLILLLWIFIGVTSLFAALGIKVIVPGVGPFIAAVIGLVVGVGGVFSVFITRADQRFREKIEARIKGEDVEDVIDRYYEETSTDPTTTD